MSDETPTKDQAAIKAAIQRDPSLAAAIKKVREAGLVVALPRKQWRR